MTSDTRAQRKRELEKELAEIERAEKIDELRRSVGEEFRKYFDYSEEELSRVVDKQKQSCDTLTKIYEVMYNSTSNKRPFAFVPPINPKWRRFEQK